MQSLRPSKSIWHSDSSATDTFWGCSRLKSVFLIIYTDGLGLFLNVGGEIVYAKLFSWLNNGARLPHRHSGHSACWMFEVEPAFIGACKDCLEVLISIGNRYWDHRAGGAPRVDINYTMQDSQCKWENREELHRQRKVRVDNIIRIRDHIIL